MEQKFYEFNQTIESVKSIFAFYESFETSLSSSKFRSKSMLAIKDSYLNIKNEQKVLIYKGIIISVYGAWESFIRSIVMQYANMNFLFQKDYSKFPLKFQIAYIDKYIEYFYRQSNEWKMSNKCHETIKELHKGVIKSRCSINEDIYFKNYSNYRIDTVSDICATIGIRDIKHKIIGIKEFTDFIINNEQNFNAIQDDDLKLRVAFRTLEELVERRNSIAHGKGDIQLLNNELLIELIEYILLLAKSIYDIFISESIVQNEDSYQKLIFVEMLGSTTGIFTLPCDIKIGDRVTIVKGDSSSEHRVISGIFNASEMSVSEALALETVSIKFDKKIKSAWKFLCTQPINTELESTS